MDPCADAAPAPVVGSANLDAGKVDNDSRYDSYMPLGHRDVCATVVS